MTEVAAAAPAPAEAPDEGDPPPALASFLRRRPLVMLALGFGSGLPYLLVFDTLSAWLREAGLTLSVISGFFILTLINPFKFVWAPVVDHVPVPFLSRRLGKRRSWMLVAEVGMALGLFAISRSDPAHRLAFLGAAVVWTTFFTSTHDIVIDAWRIEAVGPRLQGTMAAAYQWGYRLGMITAGVVPLVIADREGWPFAYLLMSCAMIIPLIAVFAAPMPEVEARAPDHLGPPEPAGGAFVHIRRAVLDPFADFFRRFGPAGALILAFICFYRLSDFTLTVMNPYYLDLGFPKTEIAEVRKVFGVVMITLGVFLGGVSIARFGLARPLLFGAAFVPTTHLVYAWLATRGPDLRALFVCIGVDNLAEGFAGTLLIAFMSGLTTSGFTATQYALFSSLYALPGKFIGSLSGTLIEKLARLAAPGGPLSGLLGLFRGLPPLSFARAAKLGVTPDALAAGYFGFFIYASLMGSLGVIFSIILAARGLMNVPHRPEGPPREAQSRPVSA